MEHRIAAGGIVIQEGRILLVRYRDERGSYLVAPGGAIEDGESLASAAEREVKEETGVRCRARTALMIENLRAKRYQMVKVWYLCDYLDGVAVLTDGARQEGIVEVGWYAVEELGGETVFPDILLSMKMDALRSFESGIIDPGVRRADF